MRNWKAKSNKVEENQNEKRNKASFLDFYDIVDGSESMASLCTAQTVTADSSDEE
jgi:hypothetical protein